MDKVNISEIPDDGSRQKELYALAGLALYSAQVWERGMINLHLIIKSSGNVYASTIDWDKDDTSLSRRTAGQLLNNIKTKKLAPQHTVDFFEETLTLRNNLAHSYFYARAAHFMLEEGMQVMADELCEMIDRFERADALTRNIITPLNDAMGIAPSDFLKEADLLIARASKTLDCGPRKN